MLLASQLYTQRPDLAFSLVEVGARPGGESEPFYPLLDAIPRSQLLSFEPDEPLCREMQQKAGKRNIRYVASALGVCKERRKFYITKHPMCSSLYEPDSRYVDFFNALEPQAVARVIDIDTVDLDSVLVEHSVPPVDFIKIDVQGAELDVFRGASHALASVLLIVAEVEFSPMYIGQPRVGDVDRYLRDRSIVFHKFSGLCGRMIKPMGIADRPGFAIQHLWSDAAFVRDFFKLDTFTPDELLKAAVLVDVYSSPDLAARMLLEHDQRAGTGYAPRYVEAVMRGAAANAR